MFTVSILQCKKPERNASGEDESEAKRQRAQRLCPASGGGCLRVVRAEGVGISNHGGVLRVLAGRVLSDLGA